MKQYKLLKIILVLIIFSCNSKKPEKKNQLSSKTQFNTTLKKYNPISICDCNDDGIKTLKEILNIRKKFSTLELYQKDKQSVNSIDLLKKDWTIIRDNCLKKFATKLLVPSDCNKPNKIQNLKDKLSELNIKT